MVRFDHIAIAIPRMAEAPAILAGQLGGVPGAGGPSGVYRWGQWRFKAGGRLEVLEPTGADGFLHRFLARHGPGIHHVTFTVPSLAEACARAGAHGYTVVGYDGSDPGWREAFLHPREALGIVVQIAETRPPGPAGAAAGPRWEPPPGPGDPPPPVTILGVRLRARSRARAHTLWAGVLQGRPAGAEGADLIYRWPGSPLGVAVEIDPAGEEGPVAIEYASEGPRALPDGRHPVLGAAFCRIIGGSEDTRR